MGCLSVLCISLGIKLPRKARELRRRKKERVVPRGSTAGRQPGPPQHHTKNEQPAALPQTLMKRDSGIPAIDAARGNPASMIVHEPQTAISERSRDIVVDGGRKSHFDFYKKQAPAIFLPPDSLRNSSLTGVGTQFAAQPSPSTTLVPEAHNPTTIDGIRTKLLQLRVRSAFGQSKYFLPYHVLFDILNKDVVKQLLWERFSSASRPRNTNKPDRLTPQAGFPHSFPDIDEIAETVWTGRGSLDVPAYHKGFATLVLMGKPELVFDLVDKEIDDSKLPLGLFCEKGVPKLKVAAKVTDNGERVYLPCSLNWPKEDIETFEEHQWTFMAPFFAPGDRGIAHYHLWSNVILPFTQTNDGALRCDEGTYGEVFKCELHPAHHLLPRYTAASSKPDESETPQVVAVKRMRSPQTTTRAAFDKESYILTRLSRNVKPGDSGYDHLVKLLVSFDIPAAYGHASEYYLVFPWADSNLEEFWRSSHLMTKEMEQLKIVLWVAKQLLGLTEALDCLHRTPRRSNSDNDPRTKGMHADIKPANVLRYNCWRGEQASVLGTLQLADFGLSSYHRPESASLVEHRPLQQSYRPPEPELLMPVGPSLDIWSLGCLYFEFLVWMIQGYNALKDFRSERAYTLRSTESDTFYGIVEDGDLTRVEISDAVVNRAHVLGGATDFVHDLLRLIMERMLVIENRSGIHSGKSGPRRIKSPELVEKIRQICQVQHDSYFTESKRCPGELPRYEKYVVELSKTIKQIRTEYKQRRGRHAGSALL